MAVSVDATIAERLDELGLCIAPGGIVAFADIHTAERCHVHHSFVPVAVTGYALISGTFARGRFPRTRLQDVVIKRPSMDDQETLALAALCGAAVTPPFYGRPRPFIAHLLDVIARHHLEALFDPDAPPAMNGIPVRPRGIDHRTGAPIASEIRTWRRHYRDLPAHQQMMAATIVWLYTTSVDAIWLQKIQHSWHAAEAIRTLDSSGLLADWGRLVALYPAW